MNTEFDVNKLTLEQLLIVRDKLRELGLFKGQLREVKNPHKPASFWESLDWTKSNSEVARENKLGVHTVRNWRFKLGKPEVAKDVTPRPPLQRPDRPKRNIADYAHLDWLNKTDTELAKEVGLTRERLRQIRAQLGHPRVHAWELKFEQFKKHFEGRTELNYTDANKEFPLADTTFLDYCVRAGITVVRRKDPRIIHPWELYDWRLPNKCLAKIWGRYPGSIANHRGEHGKPNALFAGQRKEVPAEFLPLIEEQKRVAAEWKASKTQTEAAA